MLVHCQSNINIALRSYINIKCCNQFLIIQASLEILNTITGGANCTVACLQGGHFPVSIKFPDFLALFSQEQRRIFKGGEIFLSVPLIGVQNPQFEPPIWGTYAILKET